MSRFPEAPSGSIASSRLESVVTDGELLYRGPESSRRVVYHNRLDSDSSYSNTTYTALWTIPVVAGRQYDVQYYLDVTAASVDLRARYVLTGGGDATFHGWHKKEGSSFDGDEHHHSDSRGSRRLLSTGAITSMGTHLEFDLGSASSNIVVMRGVVNASGTGNLEIRFASSTTTTVTIETDSYCIAEQVGT